MADYCEKNWITRYGITQITKKTKTKNDITISEEEEGLIQSVTLNAIFFEKFHELLLKNLMNKIHQICHFLTTTHYVEAKCQDGTVKGW